METMATCLNANVYGTGHQTLVLAHGFGWDQTVWQYLVPYLALYFKVVVFDLAFAGTVRPEIYNKTKYSTFDGYAQDVIHLLEEMDVKHSVYLGHSMSAMVGCLAASKKQDLFERLILLAGSPRYLNDGNAYYGGLEQSNVAALLQAMKSNYSSWVSEFAPQAIGVNDTKSTEMFKESLRRMRPVVASDVAKMVFLSDLREVLKKVKVPCTIIQSEEDFVVPKNVAYYMKQQIGEASKVEILPGRGHVPQLTNYHLLLNVLNRVLAVKAKNGV